jgi:hypothetical protein
MQLSVACRNAILDSLETTIGTSAILKVRSGAKPATCATADAGTVLAAMNLPSDWLAAATAGTKDKLGTFEDTNAEAGGTAGHFRIYASDGTTCHMQGTITATGGGGDMEFDSVTISLGQYITITSFQLVAGNE